MMDGSKEGFGVWVLERDVCQEDQDSLLACSRQFQDDAAEARTGTHLSWSSDHLFAQSPSGTFEASNSFHCERILCFGRR